MGLGRAIDREARTAGCNPQTPGKSGLFLRHVHGGVKIPLRPRTVAVPRAKLTANAQQFRYLPAIALFGDGFDPGLYRGERVLNPLLDSQTLDQCDGSRSAVELKAISDHPGQRLLKQCNPFVHRPSHDTQLSFERERDVLKWSEAVFAR